MEVPEMKLSATYLRDRLRSLAKPFAICCLKCVDYIETIFMGRNSADVIFDEIEHRVS